MVIAFMGLTSSRDVTVSRTVSTRNESRPTNFSDHRPDRLSTRSPANWNADAVRRLHASASELASEPCRDAPVNQEPSRQSVPLPSTSRPMRCCVSGGIRRKRIWRVTSIVYSLKRCTPACLAISGVPIIRALCVMPCTPVGSESSRSKSRCVRDDSSDASARSAKQAASGRPELGNATTPSPPPGDCASTDLVDAVYRSKVTYLTLCSCLHHESRTHSLRSPHVVSCKLDQARG